MSPFARASAAKAASQSLRAGRALAAVIAIGCSGAASAAPAASIYNSATAAGTNITTLAVGTNSIPMGCSQPGACSSAQTSVSYIAGDAVINASATALADTNNTGNAAISQGQVSYTVDVLGPAGAAVSLLFNATQSATFSGTLVSGDSATTMVELQDNTQTSTLVQTYACAPSCTGGIIGSTSAVTNFAFTAYGGDMLTITMYALAQAAYGSPTDHTLNANADPMVTFAGGSAPAGFTLAYSPDLGGPALPVPEPDSRCLMAAGMVVLLALLGRRRHASVA